MPRIPDDAALAGALQLARLDLAPERHEQVRGTAEALLAAAATLGGLVTVDTAPAATFDARGS